MDNETKQRVLKASGWFEMNGNWQHPNLPKKLDLDSAYLYQTFRDDDDRHEGRLFDDDFGG